MILGLILACSWPGCVVEERGESPALSVEIYGLDRQWNEVIRLIEGTGFPHPAAALSSWKRQGSHEPPLGKPLEALIASFNPDLTPELKSLDRARFEFGYGPNGIPRWWSAIPDDRGILADLLTAQALTQGASLEGLSGIDVERIGVLGTALMARVGRRLALANDRTALELARVDLANPTTPLDPRIAGSGGFTARLDPKQFADAPIQARAVAAVFAALGLGPVEAFGGIEGDQFRIELRAIAAREFDTDAGVQPAWLEWIPADADLVLSMAIDQRPDAWNLLFKAADASQNVEPRVPELAPSRVRLNLFAHAGGIRFEQDVRAAILGLTIGAGLDSAGRITWARGVLHAVDEPSARNLAENLLPMFIERIGLKEMFVALSGNDVVIGWKREIILDVAGAPRVAQPSVVLWFGESWHDGQPQRLAGLRPSAIAVFWADPSTAHWLKDASPIVWTGRMTKSGPVDTIKWPGLRRLVHDWAQAARDEQ
jgi:hypothetical protein